ncbi:5-formyltetrahydrofolate cyclo-ligase [Silanimonas sp.]|uniref:5-formyltetrahydrofolate cyclo-ligase n=1 Tax=Silanimonas sp. TaxID=1929290 RepID=UPI0022C9A0ED|nr:5-formyltetrahydrofolate cyclo-ligase [Silanimonas sp.]MCZ8164376.1 5-formyltetrahydrofolate cyclo-ligase [Silanimonas sp.]
MNPSELRASMRERRRALPVRERLDAAAAVASHLLPELAAFEGRIAGYWAVGGELPLHAVQANLPATLRWCLPVLHEDGRLRFREWSAGQALEPNRHGIPEPAEGPLRAADDLAVVLVPLLAFDAKGDRLGQGGGWYDRSFAFRRTGDGAPAAAQRSPRLVGIAYGWQQADALEAADWDVPLDAVATPSAFHRFDR